MTIVGLVFIPIVMYVFLFYPERLLSLLVFSSIFEAGSVLNIGHIGLQPYYFVAILIAYRYVAAGPVRLQLPRLAGPLVVFAAWALLSAVGLPVLFSHVHAIDARQDLNEMVTIEPTGWLAPNAQNFTQSVDLVLNVLVVLYALRHPQPTLRAAKLAVAVFAVIVVLQSVSISRDISWQWLNNNPGYLHGETMELEGFSRVSGTFPEPSVAGGLIAALFCGALAMFAKEGTHGRVLLLSIGLLGLVGAGTAFAAMALGTVILGGTYFPSCWQRVQNWSILAATALCAAAAVLFTPSLLALVLAGTIQKVGSGSAVVRIAADKYGLEMALNTFGIGAGLGSVRASSFAVTMLASLGVLGVVLFSVFLARVLKTATSTFLRWAVIGLLIAQCIGIPDLSIPLLWAAIVIVITDSHAASAPCRPSNVAAFVAWVKTGLKDLLLLPRS